MFANLCIIVTQKVSVLNNCKLSLHRHVYYANLCGNHSIAATNREHNHNAAQATEIKTKN